MTVLDFPSGGASATRRSPSAVQLHDSLWRVVRGDGSVAGYVEKDSTPAGDRFRAKRFLPTQRRFSPVGEFWRFDDAFDCLRFG